MGQRALRMAIAAGLVIQIAGFLYDEYYHIANLSMTVISPVTQLQVHSGIYAGLLLVLVSSVFAVGRGNAGWGFRIVLIGAIVELLGVGADMFTHGQGYELALFHQTAYIGAVASIFGYVLLEVGALRRSRRAGGAHGDEPVRP